MPRKRAAADETDESANEMREFEIPEAANLKEVQRKIFIAGRIEILVLRHARKLIAIRSKCNYAGDEVRQILTAVSDIALSLPPIHAVFLNPLQGRIS